MSFIPPFKVLQVEVVPIGLLSLASPVLLLVRAAEDLCLRPGAPLTLPGPPVARLLHLLLVVVKLEAHVDDAADPVFVKSNLGVPARISVPTAKAS